MPALPRGRSVTRVARRVLWGLAVCSRDRRRVRRGARHALAARTARSAARSRPRVLGAVPQEPRTSVSRRPGQGRVPRLPRLRARGLQEPGDGRLREMPRQGAVTGPPRRAGIACDRVPDVPRVRPRPRSRRRASGATTSRQGNASAIVQHATADCTKCHQSGRDSVRRRRELHGLPQGAARQSTADHAGSKGCLDCHHAHEPAVVAEGQRARRATRRPRQPHPVAHDACISLPRAAHLRGERRQVHRLPWPEDHAGRSLGAGAPRMPRLPRSSRPCRGRGSVCEMPPGRPGEPRERRRLRHAATRPMATIRSPLPPPARAATPRWPRPTRAPTPEASLCASCHKAHDFAASGRQDAMPGTATRARRRSSPRIPVTPIACRATARRPCTRPLRRRWPAASVTRRSSRPHHLATSAAWLP